MRREERGDRSNFSHQSTVQFDCNWAQNELLSKETFRGIERMSAGFPWTRNCSHNFVRRKRSVQNMPRQPIPSQALQELGNLKIISPVFDHILISFYNLVFQKNKSNNLIDLSLSRIRINEIKCPLRS